MDRLDRKILRLLQEDATLAVADVAKKVGLSTTPCWRRIQKLEEELCPHFTPLPSPQLEKPRTSRQLPYTLLLFSC